MSHNLSTSMRENYDTHGVSGYYEKVAETYRNPHMPGLVKVLNTFMDRFMDHESPASIKVLDLAAGSGEATEVLLRWKASRWPSEPVPIARDATGLQFPNRAFKPANLRETKAKYPEPALSITASDPFTSPGYLARTGLRCLTFSFNDVAAGLLPPPPISSSSKEIPTASPEAASESARDDTEPVVEPYDICVISFALHLVESNSELWGLLTELSKRARWLVVTAPHKKPDIKPSWGWRRWDPSASGWGPAEGRGNSVGGAAGDGFEIVLDRVRLRVWRSEEHWSEG